MSAVPGRVHKKFNRRPAAPTIIGNEWPAGVTGQNVKNTGALTNGSVNAVFLLFTLLAVATTPARASLFTLAASGTISFNTSGDPTIPVGTPWTFELTYDTAAPDLDPDSTFGTFNNTTAPPALTSFHYRAGSYEVTLDDPTDFGIGSGMLITFTSMNGIDINIVAPTLFPHLAGGQVSFHADFNRFSPPPVLSSDALPTNTALGPGSFDQSTVMLRPPGSAVTGSSVTSLTLMSVLPGDYNRNGVVDAADYLVWRKNRGTTNSLPNDPIGGSIGAAQYNTWRSHFGQIAGSGLASSTSAAVPEPTNLALLMLAAACVCNRRLCRLLQILDRA